MKRALGCEIVEEKEPKGKALKEQMRKIVFLVIICIAFVAVFSGFGMLKRHNSDFELTESELVTIEYGEIVSLPLSNFVKANGATVEFSLVGENGKIDGESRKLCFTLHSQ